MTDQDHFTPDDIACTADVNIFLKTRARIIGRVLGQNDSNNLLTVETLSVRTLCVLFFIEIGTRRAHFAGCTPHPNLALVTQQARQPTWELQDQQLDTAPMRFLIHDRDAKFTRSFDTLFLSEGIDIVLTPYRAPRANAFAERWIRSLRESTESIVATIY